MPFVTVGEHRIHFEVQGEGEPLVLLAGTGFDLSFWDELMPALQGFRVLRLDNRGSGLSDAPDDPYSVAQMADDLAAAMDAADFPTAHVYGASLGSLVAQELAIRHPHRVRSLVLGATSAGVTMIPGAPQLLPLLLTSSRDDPEEAFRRAAPFLTQSEGLPPGPYLGHAAGRRSPVGYRRQLRAQLRYTSLTKLRRIEAPTLVMHGAQDQLIPPANARLVARLIPGAQLRLIRHAGHLYNLDNPEEANAALLDFLLDQAERVMSADTPTVGDAAAVLFTDIVDSTSHISRLGDSGWLRLLERHNDLARASVARSGGTEVRTTGDGLLAVFPEPPAAIECARALKAAVEPLGIQIRAGIHHGPFRVGDGDVHGLAVHAAARIAAAAGPGELLVSEAARALCSRGSFAPRGQRSLKGLPGTWRLFAAD